MITYLSSHDLTGQRFNGHMLQQEFNKTGTEAVNIVWIKEGFDLNTQKFTPFPGRYRLARYFDRLETILSTRSVLNLTSFFFLFSKWFWKTSLLHLHVFHWPNYFSILTLPFLSRLKPTVWTIHDFWAFSGHCVYPFECQKWKIGCGKCPYLDSNFAVKKDTTRFNWKLKKVLYSLSKFEIVVASQFMFDRVSKSPLLNKFRIHLVPFGLDLKKFTPGNKKYARNLLGIKEDHVVISFRSAPGPFKGHEEIKRALEKINASGKKVTLLTFNVPNQFNEFKDKFDVLDIGWTNSEDLTVLAYQASDIFLMPSKQESFGMMAMEAIACGVPAVVFSGTSLEEVIGNGRAGVVVKQNDVNAFTQVIENLVQDDGKRKDLSNKAREFAEETYDLKIHLKKMNAVYDLAKESF